MAPMAAEPMLAQQVLFLEGIQAGLKAGRYRASPVRRQYIDKGDEKQRPLGMPPVRDRVVQMAAKIIIELRGGLRRKQLRISSEQEREGGSGGDPQSVDQEKLMVRVREGISGRMVMKLIRMWLKAGVMGDETVRETLYDQEEGTILRSPRRYYGQRWPSPKAMKRIRKRVHALTDARHSGEEVKHVIGKLNPVLPGWGNYFRTGNADRQFHQLDTYVYQRLARWMVRLAGQRKGRMRSGPMIDSLLWVGTACVEP
jgi:hypothetical protein